MNINLFKNLPVAMAALASSVAFAGMDMDSRVSQLESQVKQSSVQNENNTFGARNANGAPMLDGGCGWFLGVGANYTQTRLTGTEFASTASVLEADYTTAGFTGSVKDIDYGWDWGLHVFGGYMFAHDGFDIRLDYNYLNTSSSAAANGGLGGSVVAISAQPDNVFTWNGVATEAKSNFSMTMNTLDLAVGRDYFVSQYLSLRPNFGLLSAWFDIEQNTSFTGGTSLGTDSYYVNDESNFWGLGPDVGLDANWFIGQGFSFFANGTTALLYGRFNIDHSENYSADVSTIDMNGDIHKIAPRFALALGLAYETYLDNNKQHLGVRLGYTVDYYLNMNQILNSATNENNFAIFTHNGGNLGMQGVTFDLTWSF